MTEKTQTHPRKRPRQSRSQATCDAILEAAARILETEGGRKLTTNHIAARAGVSVGSLYQYFPGREAIVAELVRRMRQEMLADFEEAAAQIEGKPLEDGVGELVAASLRHHTRRPELAQALEREEQTLRLADETKELKGRIHLLIATILKERGVMEPEKAALDLSALTRGMADAATQVPDTDFEDLHRRVCRAVLGYLGLPVPPLLAAAGNGIGPV